MSVVRAVQQTRGAGLGASLAAACLGVSPYMSPIGAWMQLKGWAQSMGGAPAEWGQILEPVVRGYYAAKHGFSVDGDSDRDITVPTTSIYHPDLPWLRCTPDGIARELVTIGEDDVAGWPIERTEWRQLHLVQVKTVDGRLRWHWGSSRAPTAPPHYRIQAVVEMAVTGPPRCDFAVLCGGNEYFEVIVERDADLEAAVLESLTAFWSLVERDEPPAIDGSDGWRSYFADRLPRDRQIVPASTEVEEAVAEWKRADEAARAAEDAANRSRNIIMRAASEDGATAYETTIGRVSVIRPSGCLPYVKAPAEWAKE